MVTLCVCVFIICTCFWKSSFEEHHFNWWDFPGDSDGKESACNVGDLGLIPGLGRSPGEGNGNPLQNCCLENSMDRGALWGSMESMASERVEHD